ncbi:GGDEF domain-containing protein [Streptomyces fuscichromogenes]|uniref:GGDEF domain-containing protein n=1 Tax=Streptomyces fuscichromogenes TaxID=1324013 RepID=A0A917XQF2_9ACTN|nr:GGDEF domain-containing protein [Streptomyces fuscichromogenes]GGN46295.1 GGDEF domain-containing protein [Streptomyces fuscichromogenes]
MNEILIAASLPALGWSIHASLLCRKLRAERRDPLSGLWTRRPWMDRTDRLIRQGRITHVLLLDLGFKPVNDGFGHPAGDAVLTAEGARLYDYIAQNGGPHSVCARLGGDEFVAAISVEDLPGFVDGLAHELAQPVPWPGGPLTVTASIGSTPIADVEQPSASTLLAAADAAMYAIKKSRGRHGRRAHRRTADRTASTQRVTCAAGEAEASAWRR